MRLWDDISQGKEGKIGIEEGRINRKKFAIISIKSLGKVTQDEEIYIKYWQNR